MMDLKSSQSVAQWIQSTLSSCNLPSLFVICFVCLFVAVKFCLKRHGLDWHLHDGPWIISISCSLSESNPLSRAVTSLAPPEIEFLDWFLDSSQRADADVDAQHYYQILNHLNQLLRDQSTLSSCNPPSLHLKLLCTISQNDTIFNWHLYDGP